MVKQQGSLEEMVKKKDSMRILITGSMGYVGPILTRHLRQKFPDAELIGFDTAFFAHNLTGAARLPESLLDRVHFGDIRNFPPELLDGVDAVVHLAAISNDPMGKEFEGVTEAINEKASVALAQMAEQRGVGRFVFASSCSIYGAAEGRPKRESDALNPLTAYARSKVAMENALRASNAGEMTVTCLRFATACGMSDRLRLDLVLNDFVASALATGEITVLSDGTPWRPLIDVPTWRAPSNGRSAATPTTAAVSCGQCRQRRPAIIRSGNWPRPWPPNCPAPRSASNGGAAGQALLSGRFLAFCRLAPDASAAGLAGAVGPKAARRAERHGIFGQGISHILPDAAEDAEGPHRGGPAVGRPALAVT